MSVIERLLDDFKEINRFLPAPLAVVITEYANLLPKDADDSIHYAALHRMCDAVEIMLRFFSSALFAEILKRGNFPSGIRSLLAAHIERPTMGKWLELLKETCRFLHESKFVVDFPKVMDFTSNILIKEVEGNFPKRAVPEEERIKKAYLSLRNYLAHSGRLGNSAAKKLHEIYKPRFLDLCHSLEFLKGYSLLAVFSADVFNLTGVGPQYEKITGFSFPRQIESKEGMLILCGSDKGLGGYPDKWLNIFPLANYSSILTIESQENIEKQEKHFQIYSRANQEFLEYTILSDPDDSILLNKTADDSFKRFKEIFCLEEWKKEKREEENRNLLSSELSFKELIAQLTETFVGRDEQLKELKKWIRDSNSGVCWVEGKPGMGKSALMARLFLDLKGNSWGLFSGKNAVPQKLNNVLIPYFFRTGDPLCREVKFLESVTKTIQIWLQKMGFKAPAAASDFSLSKDVKEYRKRFKELLEAFSATLQRAADKPKKLIIIMDGLDEITQSEPNVINLPFENNLPGVLWICSSRGKPAATEDTRAADCSMIFKDEGLAELSEKDIYNFLVFMTDLAKYGLIDRDIPDSNKNPFIEEVKNRSKGLPIYLSYLAEDIRSGKISFKDEKSLPRGLNKYYDTIMDRAGMSDVRTVITPVAVLFALAKEPLLIDTIKYLLRSNELIEDDSSLADEALSNINIILKDALITGDVYGKTLYHQTCREHLLNSEKTKRVRSVATKKYYPSLVDCFSEDYEQDLNNNTFCYAIRHLPIHLIEACRVTESENNLKGLVRLITKDNFVYWKAEKAALLYELIEDFTRALDEIFNRYADTNKEDLKGQIISLLLYEFPSLTQQDQKELVQEVWFEYASETLAAFCEKYRSAGREMLDALYKYDDQSLNLVRLSLRAAELTGDYEFLLKALEYETAKQLASGENAEVYDKDDEEYADLPDIHRWVVDALFLVAKQDIGAGNWQHFDLLIENLIKSLDDIFQLSDKQGLLARMASYFNIAKQRKIVILRIKSVFEVIYKIFINYPRDREVLQRLYRIAGAAGDIIIGLQAHNLVGVLVTPVYNLAAFKWNKVSDNASKKKSIEEMFTVKSNKQARIIKDFSDLILSRDYDEGRDADKTFSSLVEVAFCSGLVSSSDEMFSINRALHGHLLYHMHKFFPAEFRDRYIGKFFLGKEEGREAGLVKNFKEQISKYCPDGSVEDNLERARGMYEMLVRSLTYEAMETENPEEILNISEELVRYIINKDLGLFCQDFNIVGRQLHILTAVAIAEARVEQTYLPRTVRIIEQLRDGCLAPQATEAERWAGVSKCYFDLFYAGIFKARHVLNSFGYLVDLKSVAQNPGHIAQGVVGSDGMSFFKPPLEDVMTLFMVSHASQEDEKKVEAMQKAAGRLAMVMIGLKTVNRANVQDYFKNNEIPETVWRKIKKWSIFMERCYPTPGKKMLNAEKMVEKYYEQLALGLFTNIIIMHNKEVRAIMKNIFQQLLDANKRSSKKETINKDDLLKILKNIIKDVFDAMQSKNKGA